MMILYTKYEDEKVVWLYLREHLQFFKLRWYPLRVCLIKHFFFCWFQSSSPPFLFSIFNVLILPSSIIVQIQFAFAFLIYFSLSSVQQSLFQSFIVCLYVCLVLTVACKIQKKNYALLGYWTCFSLRFFLLMWFFDLCICVCINKSQRNVLKHKLSEWFPLLLIFFLFSAFQSEIFF